LKVLSFSLSFAPSLVLSPSFGSSPLLSSILPLPSPSFVSPPPLLLLPPFSLFLPLSSSFASSLLPSLLLILCSRRHWLY
jgi:hypothetical protein